MSTYNSITIPTSPLSSSAGSTYYNSNINQVLMSTGNGAQWVTMAGSMPIAPSNIVFSSAQKEVVRINADGSITWADGIDVDEAAKAFARSLTLGTEMVAGIGVRVRGEIRDEVYAEVIDTLRQNGKISIEELEVMRDAKTIFEIMKED